MESSPNGIDTVDSGPLIWIGNSPLRLNIISEVGGPAYLSAKKVLIGPSCSEISVIDLKPGNNKLEVWCTDKPDVFVLPNADSRILLLAFINYTVA